MVSLSLCVCVYECAPGSIGVRSWIHRSALQVIGALLSPCVHVCLPVCMFVSLCACLSPCVHVCLPVCMFVSLCACLSPCVHVCLPVCMFVSLCACLSPCVHVCLPVCVRAQIAEAPSEDPSEARAIEWLAAGAARLPPVLAIRTMGSPITRMPPTRNSDSDSEPTRPIKPTARKRADEPPEAPVAPMVGAYNRIWSLRSDWRLHWTRFGAPSEAPIGAADRSFRRVALVPDPDPHLRLSPPPRAAQTRNVRPLPFITSQPLSPQCRHDPCSTSPLFALYSLVPRRSGPYRLGMWASV
jgi:hypothetical protein